MKRILITGGNCGIGFEAARQLLQQGHHVILACRDNGRARKALDALAPVAKANGATVESAQVDLASFASIRSGAMQILQRHPRLDVLLCNAGIMSSAGRGGPLSYTEDGYEVTLQVNHLGHFLLTQLLMPALAASPAARVVVVSSELHRKATAAATTAAPGSAAATSAPGSAAAATAASASASATTSAAPSGGAAAPATAPVPAQAQAPASEQPPLASPLWLARLRRPVESGSTAAAELAAAAAAAAAAPPPTVPSGFQLYCVSKLYNLWFAYRLAALLPPHVTASAVTPGWVPGSSLGRGAPWLARLAYQYLFPLMPFTVSVHEGARRVVSVCVSPEQEAEAAGRGRCRYYSRGVPTESSPESHDAAAAEALWRLSEQAVGAALLGADVRAVPGAGATAGAGAGGEAVA